MLCPYQQEIGDATGRWACPLKPVPDPNDPLNTDEGGVAPLGEDRCWCDADYVGHQDDPQSIYVREWWYAREQAARDAAYAERSAARPTITMEEPAGA